LERAERALRKALALSPTSSLARIQEAFLLYLRKDPLFVSKALQWAEMYPNDGHGLMSLGAWLCWAGRWEDGMRLLKSSAKFNPVLPGWVHFPIADWHLRNQEYDKALEMILRSEMHDLFWYHSRLARAYARMGRMQEAHEQVLILRKIRPDYERFAAAELRKWMWDDDIGAQMEGLRLAGLNVPGESEEP
jgi:tetratricopeptide (TPR) repeat protein